MAVVVIGPSSVGKSTFLQNDIRKAHLDNKYTDVVLAYELKSTPIKNSSIIHYNMLLPGLVEYRKLKRGFQRLRLRTEEQTWNMINRSWDFNSEPKFSTIFNSKMIDRCIVLVAPTEELLERIGTREIANPEGQNQGKYRRHFWSQAVKYLPLGRIYEQLFDQLDERKIPYEVLLSSRQVNGFALSDRVYVQANLNARYIQLPDKSQVEAIAQSPKCRYQSVRLPYGIITSPKQYHHLPENRETVLKKLLPETLVGASILDVGSAMGALLFLAERLGAERLVGVELDKSRYEASIMLSDLLQSRASFVCQDFLKLDETEKYDHIFILNVIHHISDFYSFIQKAANLTLKTLTLEFPTLADKKFASFHKLSQSELAALNHLPLIGVSSNRGAGQTFVYSPQAMKHLVMSEIGGFDKCETRQSAIQERVVMVFSRKA
jgi:2-polyprenyl-3-methyl-5-hydroxy-6-metoxy-1,4-benzoquinol methylase